MPLTGLGLSEMILISASPQERWITLVAQRLVDKNPYYTEKLLRPVELDAVKALWPRKEHKSVARNLQAAIIKEIGYYYFPFLRPTDQDFEVHQDPTVYLGE
jgi:hypothetical protein